MVKREQFLRSYFVISLLFTSSMLVFGCGEKVKSSKVQAERVETKQPAGNNSTHVVKEADVIAGLHTTHRHEVNDSDSEESQFVSPAWHKELASAFYLVFK